MSTDRFLRKNSSGSRKDHEIEESISKSAASSSKRNPLVRSFRAKSSSSTTTSSLHKRKSVEVQEALLEIKELAGQDESESKDGYSPITLARWIISKGEAHGSVYLLPFEGACRVGEPDDNLQLGYRYRISGTTQPLNVRQFYTLSSTGLTSFHFGDVRFLTLDQWVAEFRNYERICTIPFFLRFKKTKSFQTWKRIVKRQKFVSATKKLSENSCIFGNAKMRHCFLQVQSLVGKLTDMGVTEILARKTYDLEDFFSRQQTLVSNFATNFGDFRHIVCQLVFDTCKATFSDAGFSSDEYPLELAEIERLAQREYEGRTLYSSSGSSGSSSSRSSSRSYQKPRKLTFIEQVNKRKACENLVRFIRLIDFMMRYTAHMIVCNSLIAVHKSLTSRAKSRPTPGELTSTDKEASGSVESDTEIPVFSCKVLLNAQIITISPNLDKFDEGFRILLTKLDEAVQSVPVLFQDVIFNPYTQPILYGKMENYKAESENFPFVHGHEESCEGIMMQIRQALVEAFEVCDLEMEAYKATASEFSDKPKTEGEGGEAAKLVDVETDVDSLKSKLANLTAQQSLAKGIRDQQNVSIFRADFKPLKRTILPNISKTIIQMQDALPKLGREKMENFNEDCKSLKDMIDFELKTSEDYVNNMDIKEKLAQRFNQLQSKLEAIENVYLIMKNIPVPVSTEDKNSLKNLKSQLKSLGTKVQDKIKAHADILERFSETLEREQLALKETVASLLQEVRSPALLELEATADEVKPTLAKIEQMLKQASAKVLQYNQYEKKYGFHITPYLELVAAEQMLKSINTVWKCTEDWDGLYTNWATVEFSLLEVDDCEEGTAMIELEIEEAKEVIGASPMSKDLMSKVNATTQRLPVLKDLRTPALKERHWKQISEVVGADLTSSGKKITMELLEKYNVFAYGSDIARIVRAASQEEQLDFMISELKQTWTEEKLTIQFCHGLPIVSDFPFLYQTVSSSNLTLKELGQSRYSIQMKDSLLYWCDVVGKANRYVRLLAKAQNLWQYQEVPLTSMLMKDKHPSKFAYFELLRRKFQKQMLQVASADALISAFGQAQDYLEMVDIVAGLEETKKLIYTVLWSLRFDSPRLFFLTQDDLLNMLFEGHNNLPVMHRYIFRIYPSISSLLLLPDTDLTVSKSGYHPEIEGIMSMDGEKIIFSEVMKARLGVEHWIKCIGIHLRVTLRMQARSYGFHNKPVTLHDIEKHWSSSNLCTQMVILTTHSSLSRILGNTQAKLSDVKAMVLRMKEHTMENIQSSGLNEVKKSRDISRLFLLEYYLDIIAKCKSLDEMAGHFLVQYTWEPERKIFRVMQANKRSCPYGYEYHGQAPLLAPIMACDKVAFNILNATAVSNGIITLRQDVRKAQLRTVAQIFGRPFFFVSSGVQDNFKEALVGSVITNTWIYVQVDDLSEQNIPLLRRLLVQLEIARKFREDFLDVFGQEVPLGQNANIFLARSTLLYSQQEPLPASVPLERFRQISLTVLPLKMKIRVALNSRGVSDKGLNLFLLIVVDRFLQLEEELGPQCIVVKMLNAIKLSISTAKLGIMQKFFNQGLDAEGMKVKMNLGQLVLDNDVYDIIKKHAKMTSEFKSYFEDIRNPSMVAAATSRAMVENCIALQTSISNFAVSCAVYNQTSNTIRRALRATENFLKSQTGCTIYDVCAQTQLGDQQTLKRILRASNECTGVLHIYGQVSIKTIGLLRNIACEYPTLKVLFSCNDKLILNQITTMMNCVKLEDDHQYNFLTCMAMGGLNEKIFGIVDKHFPLIFPLLQSSLEELQSSLIQLGQDIHDGCQIFPAERSFAITVANAFLHLSSSHDVASMLNSQEMVLDLFKESIKCSYHVFQHGQDGQEHHHPEFGRTFKEDAEFNTSQVTMRNGRPQVFIPGQPMLETIEALHFFMSHSVSVLLLGKRGCGKSLCFSKVVPHLPSGTTVKYIILGQSTDFGYESGLLTELMPYKTNIVVIENFNPDSIVQVHFVLSLLTGRCFFEEQKEKFQRLPPLTLFIEASGNCLTLEDIPYNLRYNVVTMQMHKSDESNAALVKEAMNIVSENLPENVRSCWADLHGCLTQWHVHIRSKSPFISDHTLFRTLSGLMFYMPDEELESTEDFQQFVASEMLQEYSAFLPTDVVRQELAHQLPALASTISTDNHEEEMAFMYKMPKEKGGPPHVEVLLLTAAIKQLNLSYGHIRGKNFNDRLVLSPHFSRQALSLLRAFAKYGVVTCVGPRGCGKKSAVALCAHFLDLELAPCPEANLATLLTSVKDAYKSANDENPKLLLVEVDSFETKDQVFDLLDKTFHYFDIPNVFSADEKMEQLFDEEGDRKEAVLDNKNMDEAYSDLFRRIKENLLLVMTMTPETFQRYYPQFSNVFNKSGIVRMSSWPEETLIAIAEDRFLGLEKDITVPIRNVSKACAILHLQMSTQINNMACNAVSSTQYLDMVKVLPQLHKPLQKKLQQQRHNLQTGIDQVQKANTFITKLTTEISEKEPEVLKLNTEIEQLNKRLSQERINLERASKSFRKKEAAARKKSEETQELAADAHRNLEHALPSLEAAMQAVSSIDKGELMEMRSMKNPPELTQQVLEAVCLLLGVKADWNTAKMLIGDAQFMQKLMDFDKDNIPEQVSKRVRRYIDNPKFIPDEVGKLSRIGSSLCMWVRAIDLYAKIFKSIEPKRIRLLQAESELAEAMAALREDTDRVAHIESTITSIQSNQQERVKRKSNLEANIKQTAARLERAQLLSYSLEEESARWKATLLEVDKSLQMLVGNSVISAMIVAYSSAFRQDERRLMVEKWRQICDRIKLDTNVVPANDFLSPIMTPLKHWIGKFEYYCQNYLSMRLSSKWPLLRDPHGLALEALKSQNENLIIAGFKDDRLPDILRQAVSKGHEVLVLNYDPRQIRLGLKDVFHRRMTERIHAFVGLMGIPIMRRDHRVTIDGQEVVCNSKFKLILHSTSLQVNANGKSLAIKNVHNVVLFDYSTEALEQQLLRRVMIQIDAKFCRHYEETVTNIRHLDQTVSERKENVLEILLKSEEDVLDDKSVIVSLKEAKAKVFEILNDLNQERKEMVSLENTLPVYRGIAQRLHYLLRLLDLLGPSNSVLPKTGFMHLIENTFVEDDKTFLSRFFQKVLKIILPAILSKNRYVLQMGCNVILALPATTSLTTSSFESLMKSLFECNSQDLSGVIDAALEEYLAPVNENEVEEVAIVQHQILALKSKNSQEFNIVLEVEQELVTRLMEQSGKLPVLIYGDTHGALDPVDVICELARASGFHHCPKYISADLLPPTEIGHQIVNSKKERRWLVIDNFHQVGRDLIESLSATVNHQSRLFLISSHGAIPDTSSLYSKVSSLSLTHASEPRIRRPLFLSLLGLNVPDGKPLLEGILRLHECLADNDESCDKYRYLSILVRKWRKRRANLTPEGIHALINETYGYQESSEDNKSDLIQSILRELSYTI